MRLAAFSDTHGLHRYVKVPDADVLLFAGDLMNTGYHYSEAKSFADWWNELPHKYKILVAGNHDRQFETNLRICTEYFKDTVYLEDSGVSIGGINVWGSPYQPEFCNWAFNRKRGYEIRHHWDKIPLDTDVLITHGPPAGILDNTGDMWKSERVGCSDLLERVKVVKPSVHIFGHIHNGNLLGNGVEVGANELAGTTFHNVSICSERYEPVNQPRVIDVFKK